MDRVSTRLDSRTARGSAKSKYNLVVWISQALVNTNNAGSQHISLWHALDPELWHLLCRLNSSANRMFWMFWYKQFGPEFRLGKPEHWNRYEQFAFLMDWKHRRGWTLKWSSSSLLFVLDLSDLCVTLYFIWVITASWFVRCCRANRWKLLVEPLPQMLSIWLTWWPTCVFVDAVMTQNLSFIPRLYTEPPSRKQTSLRTQMQTRILTLPQLSLTCRCASAFVSRCVCEKAEHCGVK